MIDLMIWLVVGVVVGWLASAAIPTMGAQDSVLNVAVGAAGATFGGWLVAPLLGVGTIDEEAFTFNMGALLMSLIGSIVLLVVVHAFRRRSTR
jgi:uncharacterized membrane protein YeaQ/YmgE (transglycosylase-associated protein family)